ncbi:MAG TPA: RNA methyltransferase [Phycisphaerales bacterium]|nr:RNA methyltransferase [Phycisphaerales bacterium]
MNLIPIESIDDPRVSDYANLRDVELLQRAEMGLETSGENVPGDAPVHWRARENGGPAHRGLFMGEGELVVRRMIDSPFEVRSVFLTPTRLKTIEDALRRMPEGVPVYVAEPRVLSAVVGFNIHRGILACGVRGEGASVGRLLDRDGPLLVLEDLFNHDNIGSIFRNAAALAGTRAGVVLTEKCADPLYRKCIRVSVGNVLSIPFARVESVEALSRARGGAGAPAGGWELWALSPRGDAEPLRVAVEEVARARRAGEARRVALMLGSEGPGLSASAMACADRLVRIPMRRSHENVDSLNVAVAAAIALHELGSAMEVE